MSSDPNILVGRTTVQPRAPEDIERADREMWYPADPNDSAKADTSRLVEKDDPEAAFLAVTAGMPMPQDATYRSRGGRPAKTLVEANELTMAEGDARMREEVVEKLGFDEAVNTQSRGGIEKDPGGEVQQVRFGEAENVKAARERRERERKAKEERAKAQGPAENKARAPDEDKAASKKA